jgi:TonB family protein
MSDEPQKLPLAKVAGWHLMVMVVCFLGFQLRGCHTTEAQAMERVELRFLPASGGGAEAPPQANPTPPQPRPEQPTPPPRQATQPPTPKPTVKPKQAKPKQAKPKQAKPKYTRAEEIRRRLAGEAVNPAARQNTQTSRRNNVDTRSIENALKDAVGPNTNSTTTRRGGGSSAPPDYLSQLSALLYQTWQQPYANRANNGLSVGVKLVIQRNGSLSSKRITRRSGNSEMDASVDRLLRSLSRVPPLPDSVNGSSLAVNIDLVLQR